MQPGFKRFDGELRVGVVGGDNHHSVNQAAVQEGVVIGKAGYAGRKFLFCGVNRTLFCGADGGETGAFHLAIDDIACVLHSHIGNADDSDAYLIHDWGSSFAE